MQVVSVLVRREKRIVEEERLGWEVNHDGKFVWLQNLAYRILHRFGQKAIVPITKIETIRVQVNYESIVKAANIQIEELRNLNMEAHCIYLGSDYIEKWRTEFLGMHSDMERADFVPFQIGYNRGMHMNLDRPLDNQVLGLPIILVPNFQGIFVAPKVN